MKTSNNLYKNISLSPDNIFYFSTTIANFSKISSGKSQNIPASWKVISYKAYPRFPQRLLPRPSMHKSNLFKTLISRSSSRTFTKRPISINTLGTILYFSAGITNFFTKKGERRPYPSAGGRYPLEIYPVILNMKGTPTGIYHYHVKTHSIEKIGDNTLAEKISECVNQDWIGQSAVVFIITAIFNRTTEKYGARGMRHIFTEYGHLAQNIYLTSNSLNLGCCSIGGFIEGKINSILDLDPEDEGAIGMMTIGNK